MTKRDPIDQMVSDTVAQYGRLDILVNNAGIGAAAPLMDTDEKTWDAIMNVNAKGVLLCSQAAARQMIAQGNGGRIINTSDAGKIAPGKGMPLGAYSASKYAIGLDVRDYSILVAANGRRIQDDCVDVSSDLPPEEGMVINLEASLLLLFV